MREINRIPDNAMIEVFNNQQSGSIGYTVDKVSRVWQFPGSMKKIRMEELYDAWNLRGGRILFTSGALLIKDSEAREALGLEPLDKYVLTNEETIELLKNKESSELEDVLQYCSNFVLEKIVEAAVTIPISDMGKANLIKKYSGIDIIKLIQEAEIDKIVETEVKIESTSTRQRRRIIKE